MTVLLEIKMYKISFYNDLFLVYDLRPVQGKKRLVMAKQHKSHLHQDVVK